jgi:hypothetical protein
MEQGEQDAGQGSAISGLDAIAAALNRIADAILVHARATAGEPEESDQDDQDLDLSGRPLR